MLILTLRTDKPEAEIALFEDDTLIEEAVWEAHRKLAETIHKKIQVLLEKNDKNWSDIKGIVCYKGPGSFTGLRIGLSVANALALSNNIPIIATDCETWRIDGIKKLHDNQNQKIVTPEYGGLPHITQPRK